MKTTLIGALAATAVLSPIAAMAKTEVHILARVYRAFG